MGDSVVTGVVGFEIINEMFQRQARRLETQLQNQENDRKAVEHTQAQLLVMQAQLQWHAADTSDLHAAPLSGALQILGAA